MNPQSPETATRGAGQSGTGALSSRKALTIGAVAKILGREFDEVSISKIRYLEDQKLLSPRRTPGGYRLYSQNDVERLRTILRLQRDEFLPLRVIRQELAAGSGDRDEGRSRAAGQRRAVSVESTGGSGRFTLEELVEQTGATPDLIRELQEYRIVQPARANGAQIYDDSDREIVQAATELTRYGVDGRHLKVFRTSADREAGLLEQVLGPRLRSQNRSSRREAMETLETLVAACGNLKHLLLVRDLHKLTGE
ncbi:MAG: transcriptional regulator FtsR [Solirubrobacterales bacterium]